MMAIRVRQMENPGGKDIIGVATLLAIVAFVMGLFAFIAFKYWVDAEYKK